MAAPLYETLRSYAAQNPLRMHMPGHKGKAMSVPELAQVAAIDLTEITPTGNLYEAGEPFDLAQQLWAEVFGVEFCQMLTGGSTMGVHTGLTLCAPPGSEILVDRSCHRSVFHAMALLDLKPIYLERPWLAGEGICGPVVPSQVEKALENHPNIKTVCITSPTYYGVLSDVEEISHIVHAHGGKLMVDGAHGGHLPFLGIDPFRGADAVAVSAHKTLPAMGQSALLLTRGFDPELVRRRATLYGSSSPSYPILASMDLARAELEGAAGERYRQLAGETARLRERFPGIGAHLVLDPCRFTVRSRDGFALAERLEELGIFAEMADAGHVVFILTCADSREDLERLARGLEANRALLGDRGQPLPPPPVPEVVLSQRQALFAPTQTLPLAQCEGRVAACQLAPYPPGVPVVAPGERIGKKELAYFSQIGYNNHQVQVVEG